MTTPICPRCSKPFRLESFLGGVSGYSPVTNSGGSACPECHQALEFRVAAGLLELGYTYWAGSLHSEAIASFRLAGLRVVTTEGCLAVSFKGRNFPLSPQRAVPGS